MTDDYTFDADLAIADTEIERLRSENKSLKEENALQQTTIKGFMAALDLVNEKCADLKQTIADRDREIVDLNLALECVKKNNLSRKTQLEERDREIEELQASLRNHHEQFDNLRLGAEVTYKAIAMMLEALKGDRKPDETKEVDGVMVTFRNYDDNLTHHQKNIIIGNIQRAIGNEIKKLKGRKLIDISYDEQPF